MDADIALTKSNIHRRSPGRVGPLPTRGTLDVRFGISVPPRRASRRLLQPPGMRSV